MDKFKNIFGLILVVYPILQAYLRGKGVDLPDLGDYTAISQIGGSALLAQSNKLVKK